MSRPQPINEASAEQQLRDEYERVMGKAPDELAGMICKISAARTLLGPDGELLAEKRGWLRISDYGLYCARPLNQRQRDKLFDYCEHFRCDYHEVTALIKLA